MLTHDSIRGIFEFTSQTLRQGFLSSFVFDISTCQMGDPFGHTEPWQDPSSLSLPLSLDDASSTCHEKNDPSHLGGDFFML